MKKLIVLIIISLLFTGCSGKNDRKDNSGNEKEASSELQNENSNESSSEDNRSTGSGKSLFGSKASEVKNTVSDEITLEQCPENTIMACRGYFGENNCLVITYTPDGLVVSASDVIEYSESEDIPEPAYENIRTVELDPNKDILMEAPKANYETVK